MSTTTPLGRLHRVDLRAVWTNEASGFTPWLAQEENLKLLGEAIGLDLALEAQEQSVGPFRADLLCKDTANDHWVLVENQIERTDHGHLGQLLTYAAGLSAVTIVWIARRFTDEHRAALDWLNEVTNENIAFFGLEIELWRIGDSIPAPKFNVVSEPNQFVKTQVARRTSATSGMPYTEYWAAFGEYVRSQNTTVKAVRSNSQWVNFGIGRSNIFLRASAGFRDKYLIVDFVMSQDADKVQFEALSERRVEIDERIPGLTWNRKEGKKESAVEMWWRGTDPRDPEQWIQQHEWIVRNVEQFQKVFGPYVKQLP